MEGLFSFLTLSEKLAHFFCEIPHREWLAHKGMCRRAAASVEDFLKLLGVSRQQFVTGSNQDLVLLVHTAKKLATNIGVGLGEDGFLNETNSAGRRPGVFPCGLHELKFGSKEFFEKQFSSFFGPCRS